MRIKATPEGRLLLAASSTVESREQQAQELKRMAEASDEARKALAELAEAVHMGIKMQLSYSLPFMGLLVVTILSANLPDFKSPHVQVECEDDKVRPPFQRLSAVCLQFDLHMRCMCVAFPWQGPLCRFHSDCTHSGR